MNRQGLKSTCPKAGVKIHETHNHNYSNHNNHNHSNNNNNNYRQEPFTRQSQLTKPVSFQNTTLNSLDLDLDHYSLEDLFHLFNIHLNELNEVSLKSAKQIVLKMHPDKSHLDSKYFLFFSSAYKRLYSIYEFKNKSTNKQQTTRDHDNDYYEESNKRVLDNLFEKNKDFKDPKNFNTWFNQTFEKHRMDDPNEQGYGDWLKSNDDFIAVSENVTKGNMNTIMEEKKKHMQSLTVYKGVTDSYSSTYGASLLNGDGNFTTDEYTDLRQAYTETLIPVTQEDYDKMQKFNNVSEYKRHREQVDTTPISKQEAERKLLRQQNELEYQSSALAFKYAQEAEKAKQKQQSFWGDIKQLTGW
jgi:hypothetical protein